MIINGYTGDVFIGFHEGRDYFLRFTPDLSGLREDEEFTELAFANTMRSLESVIYRDLREGTGYPRYRTCAWRKLGLFEELARTGTLDPRGPTIIDIRSELWAFGP